GPTGSRRSSPRRWPAVADHLDPVVPAAGEPLPVVVGFVAALRRAGLDISLDSTIIFSEALAEVGVDERDRVYWAGRATLLARPEDVELYDRVFAAYWEHGPAATMRPAAAVQPVTVLLDDDEAPLDGG